MQGVLVGTVGNRLLGVMVLELLGSSTFLSHPVGCGITLAPKMLLSDAECPRKKDVPHKEHLGGTLLRTKFTFEFSCILCTDKGHSVTRKYVFSNCTCTQIHIP